MEIVRRIKARLEQLELSPRKASLDAGFDAAFLHTLFIGRKRGFNIEAVPALARVLNCSPEWLLTGIDPETGSREVPVLSYVGGGAVVLPVNDDTTSVPVTGDVPEDAFALIVRGNSMVPIYGDGDILVCVRVADPTDLLYRDAVVDLRDGRRMVKSLRTGSKPGLFTLESLSDTPIRDVEVVHAAKIVAVRKA